MAIGNCGARCIEEALDNPGAKFCASRTRDGRYLLDSWNLDLDWVSAGVLQDAGPPGSPR
ncbi:hypothetical protein [Engelhardtia mirabilis]|uniref:hypothetical protein n=1 Tax=Engelhardtia mirabilis TaxID=2528011 RepID=UPI0011A3A3CE